MPHIVKYCYKLYEVNDNVEMFNTYNVKPTCLETGMVPVDLDVTPMDNSKTHKEGVSYTYKGFVGYAPMMAYNILRLIGQESLKSKRAPKSKHPVKRRRIRTVISNLIQIVGHVTTHGRRVVLALGRSNIWRQAFMDVYKRFALA